MLTSRSAYTPSPVSGDYIRGCAQAHRERRVPAKTEEEAEPWDPEPNVRERAGSWDSEVVAHAQAGVGL
ncbi:unnamed protein product [Lampetra planeri]